MLAATVARRTLALLRAGGVLEEEAVPDRALDVSPQGVGNPIPSLTVTGPCLERSTQSHSRA